MIKNMQQAVAIQSRRIAAGKKGIARAVRRHLKSKSLTVHNTMDWFAYNDLKHSLPFIDPYPLKETKENE